MHDGALLASRASPALQEDAGLVGGTIIRLHDAPWGYADAPSDGLSSKFCALAPRGSAFMDGQKPLPASPQQSIAPGTLTVRPLLLKPQWMNGLSERLLVSHYVNNYGGALRRLNAIRARLARLDWASTPVFEINGLKREELIAAGSIILHEVYFESLGGHGDSPPTGLAEPTDQLARALERDFGSVAAWRAVFTAIAKALAGGSVWAILAWSGRFGRLVKQWAADQANALAGATPILALDMYEHAYHLDFGARAG